MNQNILLAAEGGYYFIRGLFCFCLLSLFFFIKGNSRRWVPVCIALGLGTFHVINVIAVKYCFSNGELLMQTGVLTAAALNIYQGRKKEIVCFVWAYNVVLQMLELFFMTLLLLLNDGIIGNTTVRIIFLLIFTAMFSAGYLFVNRTDRMISIFSWKILFCLGVCGSLSVIFFQRIYLEGIQSYILSAWKVFGLYAVLFLMGITAYEIWRQRQQKYKMIQLKNKMLEQNYYNILNMYRENARLFHDFYAHMNVIRHYIQVEDTSKCLDYVNNIIRPEGTSQKYVWTDNEIIDLIINYKKHEALERAVTICIEADHIGETKIPEVDMCAVLSNLIDNAVENCDPKKGIVDLQIKKRNDILIIVIKNQMKNECLKRKGKLESTKKDKSIHGIGLDSVQHSVDKNGGRFDYFIQSGCFEAMVTLSIG